MASGIKGHNSVLWALAAVHGLTVKTANAKLINVLKIDDNFQKKLSLSALHFNISLFFFFFFYTLCG